MRPEQMRPDPDRVIGGVAYYTGTGVARAVGVSRQTLWRWRSEGRVPAGHRFRDRQILFTAEELGEIREYANRLEPAGLKATPSPRRGAEASEL